ncbi:GGDEF domain-containing protein [Candidatus Woesearchaeota archaeon]|nr:GGDEF domain-containing protein [Candidatus Woesearchaeota archaeon]
MAKSKLYDSGKYRNAVEYLKQLWAHNPKATGLQGVIEVVEHLQTLATTNPVSGHNNSTVRDDDVNRLSLSKIGNRRLNGENSVYVAKIDIDYFGRFNKIYGEKVGDNVLRLTVSTLAKSIRETDRLKEVGDKKFRKAYHLHGEEMELILATEHDYSALSAANRCRLLIATESIKTSPHEEITISIGLTKWEKERAEPYESAAQRADYNMQLAKTAGRNRVCLWNENAKYFVIHPEPKKSLGYALKVWRLNTKRFTLAEMMDSQHTAEPVMA